MASGRPLLEGESHQLQRRSQKCQTPSACEGGMGRSTGGVIRAGMVAHSPIHTLPTLSHSIIRYRIILPTPLHSAHCVTAPPTPLLPTHLMQGTMMLLIPPSLTLIFRQRLDRVWRLIFVTLRTCTHCVVTPICVSPTHFTSAVSVCVLG